MCSWRGSGGINFHQIDLYVGQSLIQTLYCDWSYVHVKRRDNDGIAVKHQIGAALPHDRLQNRFQRYLKLARCAGKARLDFSLPLLDTGLKRSLLGGEILRPLFANIGRQNGQLLLQLRGFALQLGFFPPELGLCLF